MSATSSYKTYLMHGSGSGTITWSKLVDIKDFPDLGSAPELLDTTTLSDKMKTYILGIQNNEGLTFQANYDKSNYQTLEGLKGKTEHYAVWFGTNASGEPSGGDGKFTFDGQLDVFAAGAGVNEVRNMTITIAPTTEITFS